jgi:hypothetical protein
MSRDEIKHESLFLKGQKKIQSQIELIFETHDLGHETKIIP